MKKIAFLIVSALIVLTTIGVGTWAYFSDTQSSTANVFTAGTLDLGISHDGSAATGDDTAAFVASTWAPGATKSGTLTVNNAGSIAMAHLTVSFTYGTNGTNDDGTVDTSGRPLTITPGAPYSLSTDAFDKMIKVTTATWNGVTQDGTSGSATIVGQTLFQLKAAGALSLGSLAASTHQDLVLIFTFDSTATNGCQGNALTMKVVFSGTQN